MRDFIRPAWLVGGGSGTKFSLLAQNGSKSGFWRVLGEFCTGWVCQGRERGEFCTGWAAKPGGRESFVPVRPASRTSFVPAIGTVCYAYDAAMFERLTSLFARTLIGSAVGPWDDRQFGDFRLWIENREHLRIVYTNSESKDNEPTEEVLAQCSFRVDDRQVTVTRLEVARCARWVGWGTELILELRRRFPDCQIGVSGIEIDPNGIAFWKKLSEEGLIVADELPDCEEILEMHRRSPTSLCRETWEPPVQATDAARRVKAEYDQQLFAVLSRS